MEGPAPECVPEGAAERLEAQRKVLSTLLARFTADRDVLITAVRECERQVAALAARLDAMPAGGGKNSEHPQTVAPAQLAELQEKIALVQREQRQAATQARATAEHAMLRADEALRSIEELGTVRQLPNGQTEQLLERLAKDNDALRASVRDSAEQVAAVAAQSDTDRGRSAEQLAELRQLIEQVHLNQQQAESRAREAERNTMSCVRDALRRVEELGGTLRTSERTSAELAALHDAADRLTADVEQVRAETARCKQVLATCAQTGVVSELVQRVARMQGDMRLLQQAVGEARDAPPQHPASPAHRGAQARSRWLRPALLMAALTL
ncbi:MAG: hypothetical protein ACE5I7_19090, partial [Candidatus Binatia bacterium]